MGKYTKQNMDTVNTAMAVFTATVFMSTVLPLLVGVAKDIAGYIDRISTETGEDGLPLFTGALHDTTGIGIYYQGSLVAVERPVPLYNLQGSLPYFQQDFDPGAVLDEALKNAGATSKDGAWMVIFAAAPYAIEVNTDGSYAKNPRGEGFFWDITAYAEDRLRAIFKNSAA